MSNPIARTAYYTLGVRAWDAAQPEPLCGDTHAALFMDEAARAVWHQFRGFRRPNASNALRHRIIDDQLRAELAAARDAPVVVIGAGFDTRAFRLPGGRWTEIDEPSLLAVKEERLPAAGAPNPLVRVPIEFARESLGEKLAACAGPERTHVVLEGVLLYLTDPERRDLLATLRASFPRHVVYCDLMRRTFFETYSREVHEHILGLGARFRDLSETPEQLFLEAGYRPLSCTSIPLRLAELGGVGIPALAVRLLRKLRNGYRICRFELDTT
jgi:methyltransferase (TIGR00027 family)